MTGPSETRIMLWVLAQLRKRYPNSLWERQNVLVAKTQGRTIRAGTNGQADIRGIHKGIAVELEIKKPYEKQTFTQIRRQFDITRAGGVYAVVHNPEEAFAIIEAI